MSCEQTALAAFADVLRLERELEVAVHAVVGLTWCVGWQRELIREQAAKEVKRDELLERREEELQLLRDELAAYRHAVAS